MGVSVRARRNLGFCGRCKENSTVVKIHTNKQGIKTRSILCLNRGHGLISSEVLGKAANG